MSGFREVVGLRFVLDYTDTRPLLREIPLWIGKHHDIVFDRSCISLTAFGLDREVTLSRLEMTFTSIVSNATDPRVYPCKMRLLSS